MVYTGMSQCVCVWGGGGGEKGPEFLGVFFFEKKN